jgi:hypothetical protein
MIDMEAYKLMRGRDDNPANQSELGNNELENEEPPSGAFILMLSATIKGYGFHDKKWRMLKKSLGRTHTDHHNRYSTRRAYPGHQMEQ